MSWAGGRSYPELAAQFSEAKLHPFCNPWTAIYDFTPQWETGTTHFSFSSAEKQDEITSTMRARCAHVVCARVRVFGGRRRACVCVLFCSKGGSRVWLHSLGTPCAGHALSCQPNDSPRRVGPVAMTAGRLERRPRAAENGGFWQ